MDQPITAAEMAELHPMLFRTSQPKPGASISEQYAFAAAAARVPHSPAYCSWLAASQSGKAS